MQKINNKENKLKNKFSLFFIFFEFSGIFLGQTKKYVLISDNKSDIVFRNFKKTGILLESFEEDLEFNIKKLKDKISLDFNNFDKVGVLRFPSHDIYVYRSFLKGNYIHPRDLPKFENINENIFWISVEKLFETKKDFFHSTSWLVDFCLDTRGIEQSFDISYERL